MNPGIQKLQPYPVEKLVKLFSSTKAPEELRPIDLSIGEPRHPLPVLVAEAMTSNTHELSIYPSTRGSARLRGAIASWAERRYGISGLDPRTQVLPTLGSREALFSVAQALADSSDGKGLVLCPNPFYQIYEGAALLSGLSVHYLNTLEEEDFRLDWKRIPKGTWKHIQIVYVCSPGNPHGSVVTLEEWEELFELADRHGFVIISDECYSEIYFNETSPPLGALEACTRLGRSDFSRLIVMGSLSKRSSVPGLRSGYAIGDATILEIFRRYRTYHGSAMSGVVQAASIAAWEDESHVVKNRAMYAEKFRIFHQRLNPLLPTRLPEAAFYLWLETPIDDQEFAVGLLRSRNLRVLPGSFLSRKVAGVNPGERRVRIALVSSLVETAEAAERLADYVASL